ncbi:hypothetical protein [uncultured Brachyspira sp.]|uniref:hypothetical protein n=3 Tax=uncultured Brachyspira sp. TaxID=221953 RepID=UPI0025EC9F21|nr:hypothetical protein [uncultured Brachyspira sp.]
MNNKLQTLKYKITLFFIGIIFLSASFIIIYLNFRFNDNNIIKVNANIESIYYYEYGTIKKRKFANVVYSFNYNNKKIFLTNSYLDKLDDTYFVNAEKELFYDKNSRDLVNKPSKYTLVLAFIFIILAIVIIVFAVKLKQSNIYVSSRNLYNK